MNPKSDSGIASTIPPAHHEKNPSKKINRPLVGLLLMIFLITSASIYLLGNWKSYDRSSQVVSSNSMQEKISDKSFQILYVSQDKYQRPMDLFVSNIDESDKKNVTAGNNDNFRYALIGNGKYISRANGNRLEVANVNDYVFKPIDTIEHKNPALSHATVTIDDGYFWYSTTRNLLPVPQGQGDPYEIKIYISPIAGGESTLLTTYRTKESNKELLGIDFENNRGYWTEYCFECEGKIYIENLRSGIKIYETNKNYVPFWKSPKVFASDFSKVYYFTYENKLIEYDLLTNTPKTLYGFSGLDPETSPFVDLFLTKDNKKLYFLKSQGEENSSLYVFSLPDGKPMLLKKSLPIRFKNYVTFSPDGRYLWYTNDFEERIFDTKTKEDYLFFTETTKKERSNIDPNKMITVVDNGISFLGWIPKE